MLLGPMALFGLIQLSKNSTSSGVVGERKIISSVIWPRCENTFTMFSFSLWQQHLQKKYIKMICNKFSIC